MTDNFIKKQEAHIRRSVDNMKYVVEDAMLAYPYRDKSAIKKTVELYLDHVLKDMDDSEFSKRLHEVD